MKGKNYKYLFFLSVIANIMVAIIIFTPMTNLLYRWLEVRPDIRKADAIILLGSAVYSDKILAGMTYQRLFHALELYKRGYADKIIVSAGSVCGEKELVAETMKSFLIDLGVRKEDIITEAASKNTYESIRNILPVLDTLNIKDSLLVTSSFHMFRSLAICRKLGVRVYAAPVPCYEKDITNFWLKTTHISLILREYGAILYFKLHRWI